MDFSKLNKASFTNIMAYTFIILTFVFDFIIVFKKFPVENRDIIIGLVNILNSGGLIMILSFFFGSSKSSQQKDETINTLTKTNEENNAETK